MSFRLPDPASIRREPKADRSSIEYKLAATINKGLRIFGGVDSGIASEAFATGVQAFTEVLADDTLLDELVMETSQSFVIGIRDHVTGETRRRLMVNGLLTIEDPTRPTGTRDCLIPLEDRSAYEPVIDGFLEKNAEIVVNADSVGEFRTATTMQISELVHRVTAELLWLGSDSGIVQATGGVNVVKNRLLKENPRALRILRSIERLGNDLLACAENPEKTLEQKLQATPGLEDHVRNAFIVSLRKELTEVFNSIEAEARARKRAQKQGSHVVSRSATPSLPDKSNPTRREPESTDIAEADHEVHYGAPMAVNILSRWSDEPTEALARTVRIGEREIKIIYDYDPLLAPIAKQVRKKHAPRKGQISQLDRIMLLEAKAYLTGANSQTYNGSGTSKTVSRRDRSIAYQGMDLRYSGNVRSSHVMRVFYSLAKQGDLLLEPDQEGGLCLVVCAESDKDSEPTILQRIKGVGAQQIRRGM